MTNAAYILVVTCELDGEQQRFMFDYISEDTTSLSSDLTTHPMVNGDMVADHMYKQPLTVTYSGKFSLYGNKRTEYGKEDRLEQIQNIFERIKNEAIICELSTEAADGQSPNRFKKRNNMVLTGITWRQQQALVEFDFTFSEVLFVDTDEFDYNKNTSDEYLPSLTSPVQLNFTDVLVDFSDIDKYLIEELTKANIITEGFLQFVITAIEKNNFTKDELTEEGYKAIKRLAVSSEVIGNVRGNYISGAAGLFVGISLNPLIGTIVGTLTKGILKKSTSKKQQLYKAFQLYKDDKKNRAEVDRFASFVGSIHNALSKLNDYIKIYAFPSNQEQVSSIYIDNTYYSFKLTKNAIHNFAYYGLNVTALTDYGEKTICANTSINQTAKTSFYNCNDTNYIFRTENTGQYVYVVSLEATQLSSNISEEEYNEIMSKLFNYAILVSDINPKEYNEILIKIIQQALSV